MPLLAQRLVVQEPASIGQETYALDSDIWGSETPDVLLMFGNERWLAGSVFHAGFTMGAATASGEQASSSMFMRDGQSTTDNDARFASDAVMSHSWFGGTLSEAQFVSFGSAEFTLDWTDVTSQSYRWECVLLGGSSLSNAKVVINNGPTDGDTGVYTYTVGFQPNMVLIGGCNATGLHTTSQSVQNFYGFSDFSTDRGIGTYSGNGLSTSAPYQQHEASIINAINSSGSQEFQASVDSATATAFKLDFTTNNSDAGAFWALAMEVDEATVITSDQPTTDTTQDNSLSFYPKFALTMSDSRVGSSGIKQGIMFNAGAWDAADNQSSRGASDEWGQSTTDTERYTNLTAAMQHWDYTPASDGICVLSGHGQALREAHTGTDGTQRRMSMLILGDQTAPAADVTYYQQRDCVLRGGVHPHRAVGGTPLTEHPAQQYQRDRRFEAGWLPFYHSGAQSDLIRDRRFQAWNFDGSSDYLQHDTLLSLGIRGQDAAGNTVADAQVSAFVWIKPTSVASNQSIWSHWDTTDADERYELLLNSSAKLTGQVGDGLGGSVTLSTDGPSIPAGEWTHVGWTINVASSAARCRRYINGQFIGTEDSLSTLNALIANSSGVAAGFGARIEDTSTYFGGRMALPTIYNYEIGKGAARRLYLDQRRQPTRWTHRDWFNGGIQKPLVGGGSAVPYLLHRFMRG